MTADQVLIINDSDVLCDISVDCDILFNKPCQVYGGVKTSGDICVHTSVVFHGDVECRSVYSILDDVIVFKKTLRCNAVEVSAGLVCKNLVVRDYLVYDGFRLKYDSFRLNGLIVNSVRQGETMIGSKREAVEESRELVVASPSLPATVAGVCMVCHDEKLVEVFSSATDRNIFICPECTERLSDGEEPCDIQWVGDRRVPSSWEVCHFTEEEKEFYAENGYVDFPVKYPEDRPFIHISTESRDGDLVYKEIVVGDPTGRYLDSEDIEQYRKRVQYNGGATAIGLQCVATAASILMCLNLIPIFGPVLSMAGCAAAVGVAWKGSKKIENYLNDRYIIPSEIHARKLLIEGRQQDEETKQRSSLIVI